MTHSVRVHPDAKAELRAACDYYRAIDPDLARRLVAQTAAAVRYLREFPQASPVLFEDYRHVVLPQFPYMLIYAVTGRVVSVVAILHVRRDPAWIQHQVVDRV